MRIITIIATLWLLCSAGMAQNNAPQIETTQQPAKEPPIISFTLDFPEGHPPFYNIAIESTGRAEYKSTPKPKNVGDPYLLKFVASEPTTTRIFQLAERLNFFRGDFDYTRNKVAFTGTKILFFKNASEEHQTAYNWSENPEIQEITATFQKIEETIEFGRELEDKYRFDRLGVDAVLKTMEQEGKADRLAEIQAIQPILSHIAKDSGMMNISRRRAEFLLSKIPKGAATVTAGQQ